MLPYELWPPEHRNAGRAGRGDTSTTAMRHRNTGRIRRKHANGGQISGAVGARVLIERRLPRAGPAPSPRPSYSVMTRAARDQPLPAPIKPSTEAHGHRRERVLQQIEQKPTRKVKWQHEHRRVPNSGRNRGQRNPGNRDRELLDEPAHQRLEHHGERARRPYRRPVPGSSRRAPGRARPDHRSGRETRRPAPEANRTGATVVGTAAASQQPPLKTPGEPARACGIEHGVSPRHDGGRP